MSEEKMIFVVGSSRSGTTMLGRILAGHGDIYTFGELHFFEHLVDIARFSQPGELSKKESVQVVKKLLVRARDGFFSKSEGDEYSDEALELVESCGSLRPSEVYKQFLAYETRRHGGRIPCEQTPRYLFAAEEILQAYSNSIVIYMERDPRDVALSQRSKWKRRSLGASNIPISETIRAWANFHPYLVARLWVACARHARRIKSDRFIRVQFEHLLEHPAQCVAEVCRRAGLSFHHSMLSIPQIGSSDAQDRADIQGVSGSRAYTWKRSPNPIFQRQIVEWVCKRQMSEAGYCGLHDNGRFNFWVAIGLINLPITLVLAFILNFDRFPFLISSIRKRLG